MAVVMAPKIRQHFRNHSKIQVDHYYGSSASLIIGLLPLLRMLYGDSFFGGAP
jgi:hypothetical protein